MDSCFGAQAEHLVAKLVELPFLLFEKFFRACFRFHFLYFFRRGLLFVVFGLFRRGVRFVFDVFRRVGFFSHSAVCTP